MPSDRWRIRRAQLSDLPRLLELDEAAFGLEALSRPQLRHFVQRSPSRLLVAALPGGVVAGMILIGLRRGRPFARIDSIVVGRIHRRRGIARALLHQAIELARQRKLEQIVLEVEPHNRGAIDLYDSEGFGDRLTVADYYGEGRSALRLRLSLSPIRRTRSGAHP